MQAIKRLFVGVKISSDLKEDFEPVLKKLKISAEKARIEVKWIQPQNFHITLLFLGNLEAERIPVIQNELQTVSKTWQPMTLKVHNMGAFPNEYHARVLWFGVQKKVELVGLQQDLASVFFNKGFSKDEYEFSPHITVGRIRKTRSTRDLISPFVRKEFGNFLIDRLVLFESQKQNNLTVYLPLSEYPLQTAVS